MPDLKSKMVVHVFGSTAQSAHPRKSEQRTYTSGPMLGCDSGYTSGLRTTRKTNGESPRPAEGEKTYTERHGPKGLGKVGLRWVADGFGSLAPGLRRYAARRWMPGNDYRHLPFSGASTRPIVTSERLSAPGYASMVGVLSLVGSPSGRVTSAMGRASF